MSAADIKDLLLTTPRVNFAARASEHHRQIRANNQKIQSMLDILSDSQRDDQLYMAILERQLREVNQQLEFERRETITKQEAFLRAIAALQDQSRGNKTDFERHIQVVEQTLTEAKQSEQAELEKRLQLEAELKNLKTEQLHREYKTAKEIQSRLVILFDIVARLESSASIPLAHPAAVSNEAEHKAEKERVQALQTSVTELEEKIRMSDLNLINAQEKQARAESQLASISADFAAADNRAQETIRRLESALQDSTNKLHEIEQRFQETEQKLLAAQQTAELLAVTHAEELQKAQDSKVTLQQQHQAEATALRAEMAGLNESAQVSRERELVLETELNEKKAALVSTQQQLTELQTNHAAVKEVTQSQAQRLAKLQVQLDRAEESKSLAESQLLQYQQMTSAAQQKNEIRYTELQERLTQISEERDRAIAACQTAEDAKTQLLAEKQQLTTQLQELQAEGDRLQQDKKDLEAKVVETARRAADAQRLALKNKKLTLAENSAKITEIEAQRELALKAKNVADREIKGLREELAALEARWEKENQGRDEAEQALHTQQKVRDLDNQQRTALRLGSGFTASAGTGNRTPPHGRASRQTSPRRGPLSPRSVAQ